MDSDKIIAGEGLVDSLQTTIKRSDDLDEYIVRQALSVKSIGEIIERETSTMIKDMGVDNEEFEKFIADLVGRINNVYDTCFGLGYLSKDEKLANRAAELVASKNNKKEDE